MERLTSLEELQVDIDLRLLPAWQEFGEIEDEHTRGIVVAFARYAYYRGYVDAFSEPNAGSLFINNGDPIPVRRQS